MPSKPTAASGTRVPRFSPFPRRPPSPWPHVYTSPLAVDATVCLAPAATMDTMRPRMPSTSRGANCTGRAGSGGDGLLAGGARRAGTHLVFRVPVAQVAKVAQSPCVHLALVVHHHRVVRAARHVLDVDGLREIRLVRERADQARQVGVPGRPGAGRASEAAIGPGRASGRRPRTHLGRTVASPSSFSMPHVSVWPRRPWRRGGGSETASVRPPSWPQTLRTLASMPHVYRSPLAVTAALWKLPTATWTTRFP